jgi:hypothetical protein
MYIMVIWCIYYRKGSLDNLDNGFLNKYEKILKIENKFINIFFYL